MVNVQDGCLVFLLTCETSLDLSKFSSYSGHENMLNTVNVEIEKQHYEIWP